MPKIKLTKQQQQTILAVVLMAGMVTFGYVQYFLRPTLKKIKADKAKISELSKRVDDLDRRARNRERLVSEIDQAEKTWVFLRAKLPDKKNLPQILQTINQLTRRFRIRMGSINPQGITSSELYYEIPFGLTVTCSYHDLALFLAAMGETERIFHARGVSISPSPPTANEPWVSISANLTLVTFQYKGS
ncbi:MAG: type 4a pilus biogenesis protein PilO [Elusimicrobia bacterium]|nr:type 4a pilus biogenesis protein PilO [Elusimicrobiota bacterium]